MDTNLLEIIRLIYNLEDVTEEQRYMKYEATWILTNLSMGSSDTVALILDEKWGVLDHISRCLQTDLKELLK